MLVDLVSDSSRFAACRDHFDLGVHLLRRGEVIAFHGLPPVDEQDGADDRVVSASSDLAAAVALALGRGVLAIARA